MGYLELRGYCRALRFTLHMCQSHGPRFLAGDFNLLPSELHLLDQWRALGFREVQDIFWERAGIEPRPTCKHCTRKDYLFLSPELQEALVSFHLDDTIFPDHSVLSASFQLGSSSIPRLLWRMPRQRAPSKDAGVLPDDPSNPPLQDFHLQLARNPSQAYRDLAGRFENRLSSFYESKGLPTLTKAERGRACTEQVKGVRAPPVPVRKARQGEVEATYFGGGVRHSHWFKQLRRMQALVQSLYKQGSSLSAREHRASLWHSIVCAPGFGCSFHSYWPTREIQLACDPVVVPDAIPALEEAQALFRSFQVNVEALERKLNKTRSQEAKARRQMNPFLIFKDLHDAPAKPVARLVTGTSSTVQAVDPTEAAVELSPEASFMPEAPVWIDGQQYQVVHSEPDKLWVHPSPEVREGARVSQESFIGDLQGLFAAFGQEWSRFWTRHSQDRPERWTAAIQDSHLPAVPEMRLPPITSAQWRAAVRKKKHYSAAGLDGWSRADLLLFPEDLLQELLAVYAHAESCGVWPRQALEGLVSALEKRPSACSVGHYRPITVLAMSYRVWSSIRARQCLLHLSQLQVPWPLPESWVFLWG